MTHKTVITVVGPVAERPVAHEACLVVIYGLDLGRKHRLDRSLVTIGRSSRSDIQIDQESVSRHHARLDTAGGKVVVRDLGSTNGTYVNDEPVRERALADGDLLKIGRTIFKFLAGDNIEAAYHDEVYRLTTVDGLTQAINKRYFLEVLERELSRARRHRRPLSLLLFDIDLFKRVNDTFGHLAGDEVLRQLAAAVMARIRREDVLARYGGEEFAVILPETDAAGAHDMAEIIRRLVEEANLVVDGRRIPVTISVGVASAGREEGDARTDALALVQRADDKLFEAKRAGRNLSRG